MSIFYFNLLITVNGNPLIQFDNKTKRINFDFTIKKNTFNLNTCEINLKNFPYPDKLVENGMLSRLGNTKESVYQYQLSAGYDTISDIVSEGRCGVFSDTGSNNEFMFSIKGIEADFRPLGSIGNIQDLYKSFLSYETTALQYYPLEKLEIPILKNISWRNGLSQIYPKTVFNTSNANIDKLTTFTNVSLYQILKNLQQSTGCMWAFNNTNLVIYDATIDISKLKVIDLKNPSQQLGSPVLKTTNPYLYGTNQSPEFQINRIWELETVFNPIFEFRDAVSFVDKYYNTHKGCIVGISHKMNLSKQRTILQIAEPVDSYISN